MATPVNNIPGLTAATAGAIIEPGTDSEADDSLRRRLREATATPPESGNKQHYKTWCESIDGVGRARILPLWDGENTIKGVIIGNDGTPAAQAVVERVQEYIDPEPNGLGEGVANVGAKFTASAPAPLLINIAYTVTLAANATLALARQQTETAITEYLRSLAIDTPDGQYPIVRIAAIGALINSLPHRTRLFHPYRQLRYGQHPN